MKLARALPTPDPVPGPAPAAILLHIEGVPAAQPRARAAVRGGFARMYTPDTAKGWKNRVYLAAIQHRPEKPWNGAVLLDIDFYLPRPAKLDKPGWPANRIRAVGKPDTDNMVKAVMDALTEAGIWSDDCRVCAGYAAKWYHEQGAAPGAVVHITFEEWPK